MKMNYGIVLAWLLTTTMAMAQDVAPPEPITTSIPASVATTPIPIPTLQSRVETIETSLVQGYERDFRLEARVRRIEAMLGIPGPDHKHQWQPTTPAITRGKTVSAICSCGAFAYVPFEVKPKGDSK
jgi:hypothetical protein